MAYRADIEIGVRGAKELLQLQKQLDGTSYKIEELNKKQATIFRGIAPSISNFSRQLAQAERSLNKVAAGTLQERRAITNYVTALENSNEAKQRQNRLIEEEIVKRNGATAALRAYNAAAAAPTKRGAATTMTGAYLRGQPQFGPQPAAGFNPVAGEVRTKQKIAQLEVKRQTLISRRLVTTRELSGLQQGLVKLAQAEAKARLDSARNTAKQRGELAAAAREQKRINQYARPIGPQPAGTKAPRTGGITRGGGIGGGRRFQDIATGAGFPLLFGGGPLQAVAGGVGGAFGGLGGSIAASALVAQLETFAVGATKAGEAFNSTSTALRYMRENSLFSSKAVEENAAVLEEQGKVTELAALLTKDLTDRLGNEGVQAMRELGESTDETKRLWAELTQQLYILIQGPLNGFLNLINNFLGGMTTMQQYRNLVNDLTEADKARALALEDELTGAKRFANTQKNREAGRAGQVLPGTGSVLTPEMARKLIPQLLKMQPAPTPEQSIPVTAADRRTIKPPRVRTRVDRSAERAAREEERLQQRLAKLRLETEEIKRISEFKNRIADAEATNDRLLVARIQGEQRAYEITKQQQQALIGVKDQREQIAIKAKFAAMQVANIADSEREQIAIQRQINDAFTETVENLEYQLAISTATTREEAEQLRIRQEMASLKDEGFTDSQLERIEALRQSLNDAQQPLQKFITDSQKALRDTEQLAVDVSQGIGGAIAGSLTSGLSGLIDGSTEIKDVFANMLKSIGQILLQEAQKMIATYIAIGIARAFAGMGSNSGSSFNTNGPLGGMGVANAFAGTGAKFAEGGFVDRPTNALIGEGGEPEYVIPESKMRESMARYSRGSRGDSVIPEGGGTGSEGEVAATAVSAPIDVRYTVERINSVDYVTADQFQQGMRSAANQGAKQGEQNTLKRLQMSGSTRRRLGM